MHKNKMVIILILCIITILGLIYVGKSDNKASEISVVTDVSETSVKEKPENDIYVYVCGSVRNPGVYELARGNRICDAIELAGGLLEDANFNSINQAEFVVDGQKIFVSSIDKNVTNNDNNGLININTADQSKLITLPGIGESRANAIIEYRNKEGSFKSIQDIMKVAGIKEAAFNKIKDYICI